MSRLVIVPSSTGSIRRRRALTVACVAGLLASVTACAAPRGTEPTGDGGSSGPAAASTVEPSEPGSSGAPLDASLPPAAPVPTAAQPSPTAQPSQAAPPPPGQEPTGPGTTPSTAPSSPASPETGGGADGEQSPQAPDAAGPSALSTAQRQVVRRYAADTWRSLEAMVDERTGLIADHVRGDLTAPGEYTSPTNVAGYLWSVVAARDLGIIPADDATRRLAQTLDSLATIERHASSGMFYNWYSPSTGGKLTAWPRSGEVIEPFLSTVDNGWLAASLRVVVAADPAVSDRALALYESMNFSWFHDGSAANGAGLNRGGFWPAKPADACSEAGPVAGVFYTCHLYDTAASEARIATYVGIANGQVPASSYAAPFRTLPFRGCDASWMERPDAVTRDYDGVRVLESTYSYAGIKIVPTWGGSMFEELMPDLLVPEAEWGPRSWGVNHPATVAAQKHHGTTERGLGYWGFSPAADPSGGYGQYGVPGLSIGAARAESPSSGNGRIAGTCTDSPQRDSVDPAAPAGGDQLPEGTHAAGEESDVVTPHAAFLGLAYDPDGVLDNLQRLSDDLGMYGVGGFYDSVSVGTGAIAHTYLSLDQSMIMAAASNALLDDALKSYFVDETLEERVRPLVEQQVFGSDLP